MEKLNIVLWGTAIILGLSTSSANALAQEVEQPSMPKISCDNIAEDGIGSEYLTHTFSLESDGAQVSQHQWHYYLKSSDGEYAEIQSDSAPQFSITPMEELSGYYISDDGNVEGKIECEYTISGETRHAEPFMLTLDLKPVIIAIDIQRIDNEDMYTFRISGTVEYAGAQHITVEVEEEYNSSLRTYRIDEPETAHFTTGNITSQYASQVTIVITNEYGTIRKSYEFQPSESSGITPSSLDSGSAAHIQVFTPHGVLIYDGIAHDIRKETLPSGIYIIKEASGNATTVTKIAIP